MTAFLTALDASQNRAIPNVRSKETTLRFLASIMKFTAGLFFERPDDRFSGMFHNATSHTNHGEAYRLHPLARREGSRIKFHRIMRLRAEKHDPPSASILPTNSQPLAPVNIPISKFP